MEESILEIGSVPSYGPLVIFQVILLLFNFLLWNPFWFI